MADMTDNGQTIHFWEEHRSIKEGDMTNYANCSYFSHFGNNNDKGNHFEYNFCRDRENYGSKSVFSRSYKKYTVGNELKNMVGNAFTENVQTIHKNVGSSNNLYRNMQNI